MKIKQAIILAGGFGTRLQSIVKHLPKSMALIAGKPFLAYQLDYLQEQGIENIILSVGYMHETIIEYVGNNYNGMSISYAIEKEPLGTGGAIAFAMQDMQSDYAFVVNGDTMFSVNFSEMESFHFLQQADITIALKKIDNISRFGSVSITENHKINGFLEKNASAKSGFINGGIYIIPKNFFSTHNLQGKFSFEKDCLETKFATLNFIGFISSAYFLDIGIPEDYEKANIEFKKNNY